MFKLFKIIEYAQVFQRKMTWKLEYICYLDKLTKMGAKRINHSNSLINVNAVGAIYYA
jgi:hypothetical protein